MSNDILSRVIKVVADELSIEESEVVPGASFQDDLGADSLDLVELIMAIQEEFDVTINDETSKDIKTVQDVVNFINTYKS
ncbi:MAG: acyl carrier protein [Deltaproteobacteria bacterium]|jgi:acyl carrier protein|nr:acyl carrier protein [Deltaproteobacteria bacterium]